MRETLVAINVRLALFAIDWFSNVSEAIEEERVNQAIFARGHTTYRKVPQGNIRFRKAAQGTTR